MSGLRDLLGRWERGELDPPPIVRLIGMELIETGPGTARFRLSAGAAHHNPMGIVHGGVFCDLADAAMGAAMATTLEPGETFTTTQLQTCYFRPVREATLTAQATVVRRGRSTSYVECEITDDQGSLVAKTSSCCLILQPGASA